jgi:hypothetical protein
MKLITVQYFPFVSSYYLLGPNIFLSCVFMNTLDMFSSFIMADLLSHPSKPTRRIVVLCILLCKVLGT